MAFTEGEAYKLLLTSKFMIQANEWILRKRGNASQSGQVHTKGRMDLGVLLLPMPLHPLLEAEGAQSTLDHLDGAARTHQRGGLLTDRRVVQGPNVPEGRVDVRARGPLQGRNARHQLAAEFAHEAHQGRPLLEEEVLWTRVREG